jgi:hypothetical protein
MGLTYVLGIQGINCKFREGGILGHKNYIYNYNVNGGSLQLISFDRYI